MTLANLLAIQRLQAFDATPAGVQRLLSAAQRNLVDAGLQALSPENRFDAAYKCILQCAMLGLWAQGYRTADIVTPGCKQVGTREMGEAVLAAL